MENNTENQKVIKQHPAKLYLMVPHRNIKGGTSITLLSCAKIKAFEGILPTEEILQTHFTAERVRMQIAEEAIKANGGGQRYIPQPLYLEIESSIFAAIMAEARAKDPQLGGKQLVLTLGTKFPCCIITEQKPEPEADK